MQNYYLICVCVLYIYRPTFKKKNEIRILVSDSSHGTRKRFGVLA